MIRAKRVAILAAAAMTLSTAASGYYHFVHFANRTGPFNPIVERFDLTALVNRTVQFQIAEQGPDQLSPGDSFPALISQIRSAAKVWNDVDTSDLRIAFGGLASAATVQAGPAVQVVFEELPPGLLAQGGPVVRSDVAPSGFVPIQKSIVRIDRNLSQRPSWTEAMFLTFVHEIGHALGLQHTWSSGVMSTSVTRGTTKAKPLGADDIAGISVLYPAKSFGQNTGSIAGRVLFADNGQGVNLASVAVISPNGAAITALTNPDGSYRIDGIPAGQYFVYVHPIPPALDGQSYRGDLTPPIDNRQLRFDIGQYFDTVFFPGLKQPSGVISVVAGASVDNVGFSVQRRTTPPPVHSVRTYGYVGGDPTRPGILTRVASQPYVVADGVGLVSGNNTVAQGLTASVLGGAVSLAPNGLRTSSAPGYAGFAIMEFRLGQFTADGPGHLLFSASNDIYVLPNAFQVVTKQAPFIQGIAPSADGGSLVLTGFNFAPDSRVLFDGSPAIRATYDDAKGALTVVPPPAPGSYKGQVVVLNSDGQSSLFLQNPVQQSFDAADASSIGAINPASLPAGVETVVEITGVKTNFQDGQVTAGFGTSDVTVRRVIVASPTRLLVAVIVNPGAVPSSSSVTVVNGLQVYTLSGAFQTSSAGARLMSIAPPTANLQPGVAVSLTVNNLPFGSAVQVTINDLPAQVLSVAGNTVRILPPNVPAGPVIIRMTAGTDQVLPLMVTADPPLAQIVSVLLGLVFPVDASRPAHANDLLTLSVFGQLDVTPSSKVVVNIGGIDHNPVNLSTVSGGLTAQILLSPLVPVASGTAQVIVSVDGRPTAPYTLAVR